MNAEQFYYLTQIVKAYGWAAGREEFLRRFGADVLGEVVDSCAADVERARLLPELPIDWREHGPGEAHGMRIGRIGIASCASWLEGLKT